MDYDKIISATYSWFSLKKFAWFLVFFWLSVSMLFLVPWALEKQYFDNSISWIVYIFYAIIYLGVVLGFITLNCACLKNRKLKSADPTKKSIISVLLLVLAELGVFVNFIILIFLIYIFYQSRKNIFALSLLVSILVLLTFDHYLWTSAFGIILLLIILALTLKTKS